MLEPSVSVIIPIYNAARYLEEALTCLLKQSFDNFEVILIDDGSSDESSNICEQFIKRSNKFKYFYQENAGVSVARNHGIIKARGTYICFMDADDLCTFDWIESMYTVIINSNADIAMLGWNVIDEANRLIDIIRHKDAIIAAEDAISYFTSLGGSVWNKIFKKSKIVSDDPVKSIQFDVTQKFSEDILFCVSYLCKSKNIVMSSKAGYIYRNRSGSVSHAIGKKQISRYEDMLRGQKKMVDLVEDKLPGAIPSVHQFYCTSSFYAMLDFYMSGISNKIYYSNYTRVLLTDKYATNKLKVLAMLIEISPHLVFVPWIIARKMKRLIKKLSYTARGNNGSK